ncbi:MAG: SurA N-terminal domain-containing protein [Pyrinomonadaceae bacterium]|nr:SurA N-terminal domain-containing protein [Pyrinomonadaceae bacterium]
MLKSLSRLERTQKTIIILFAVLMGVSLIFFYAPSRNAANTALPNNAETLARVGNQDVTVGELGRVKDYYQQMFGGQINLAQLGGDRRLLDNLIRERVSAQEAARLNLAASDAEVADVIRKQFADASGKVDLKRYRDAVTSQYGSIEQFEQGVRNQVAAEKLRAFITAGVQISPQEVEDAYKRDNTTFELVYVPVTADKLATRIQPSDEELRRYYEEHKGDFRILEPQKKIRYIYIDQAKAGARLEISDEDLRRQFDALPPERQQGAARLQQIVLRVARPELDATVRQKADELVSQARGGAGTTTEETFAELARGRSEDPATAKNGGALANPVRSNPSKPDDPLQKALALEEGQISDPVKVGNAYYIFRRGASVPRTFEDAKPELLASARNNRSYAIAAQLAARAAARLKETQNPQAVAQELAAEANMTPAEMVKETPFVKPGDTVPDIGSSPQFEGAIAPLNNPNDVGDRTGVRGGFAIPMLIEKRDPRVPEFDEVRDQVASRVKNEQARNRLEGAARDLAANANNAGELRAAAERLGLAAETAADYKLGGTLGEAGTSPAADDAIYRLNSGDVTKQPIKINDTWVVVGATKRADANLAEFATKRTELTETALSERRNQVYGDFLLAAQERMQRDGEIKIYEDVLARIADDTPPAAAPPTIPRRPPGAVPPGG